MKINNGTKRATRKLSVDKVTYNNTGKIVWIGGTYNRYEERFYDVDRHLL